MSNRRGMVGGAHPTTVSVGRRCGWKWISIALVMHSLDLLQDWKAFVLVMRKLTVCATENVVRPQNSRKQRLGLTMTKEEKMLFKSRQLAVKVFVLSLLIQTHSAAIGYAARGAKIAFTSTRIHGLAEIYVMDSDGANQVRLTDNPALDRGPSWSPDGKRIAFVSNRDHGYDRIYVMDSDGGNVTRLTKDSTNRHPAWSPDGKRIAFVSSRDGGPEIYVMDENGENHERRTGNLAHKGSPAWSPDGRWIAYSSLDVEKVFQIYLVRADGVPQKKRLTRKLPHKYHPAWSPDGDAIAYTSEVAFENSRIHLMTAKGIYVKQFREVGNGSDGQPDWVDPTAWSVSPATGLVTIWGEIKKPKSGL